MSEKSLKLFESQANELVSLALKLSDQKDQAESRPKSDHRLARQKAIVALDEVSQIVNLLLEPRNASQDNP